MVCARTRMRTRLAAFALAPLLLVAAPAPAQNFPVGQKDYSLAPAGTYALDPQHAGVIARVSHLGYSKSVFRFDTVQGTLTWEPAQPEKSSLAATVQVGSITSNVKGFAAELSTKYLKAGAFPAATFKSTAFRKTDATHGQVNGDLSLMGKTRPVTFDVALVGAGAGFGKPRMGVEGKTEINPQDFGLPALMTDPIEIAIDVEFERQP